MLYIKDYLYHCANWRHDSEAFNIEKLRSIFQSGYIMTRSSLANLSDNNMSKRVVLPLDYQRGKKKVKVSSKKVNSNGSIDWNGPNSVSVAFNPENQELVSRYGSDGTGDAYNQMLQDGTLLISPRLLEEMKPRTGSKHMKYELQIPGNIHVSYVKGMGLKSSTLKHDLFELHIAMKKIRNNPNNKKYRAKLSELRYLTKLLSSKNAQTILNQYYGIGAYEKLIQELSLEIPLVDIEYGYPLKSSADMLKKIEQTQKEYKSFLGRKK